MKTYQKQRRDSVSREAYWMRRDRDEKMRGLYGCPMNLPPAEDNDTGVGRGLFWGLVFSVLLVGVFFALDCLANTSF